MAKKRISVVIPFETMKANIRQGEHWVRTDWTTQDKYVIIAVAKTESTVFVAVFALKGYQK